MSDARSDFLARAQRGPGMVPVLREVVLDGDTALAAFVKVARPPFAFLLESVVGGERWARYTFLGTEPREVWRYHARTVERWTKATGWNAAGDTEDPIGHLAQRMRALPAAPPLPLPPMHGLPRFTGGAVGYLGYDLVRTVERLAHPPADTLDVPDAVMMIADTLVIIDNLFGRAIVVANVEVAPRAGAAERLRLYDAAEARLEEVVTRLRGRHDLTPLALRNGLPPVSARSRYPREAFERDVARVLEYVKAGDTFQTVLSRRQEVLGAVDPLLLYRYLRALNPAPYLFYLALDDSTLVGSSPEVLVRVEGGEVTVRPIAGTRPRGRTREDDEAFAQQLLADEKERAEHMMLVDLGRNDVGRVARHGPPHDRALFPRAAPGERGARAVAGGLRRARRLQGLLPRRHGHGRAEGPRHADHRRARAGAAWPVRRRGRLRRLGRGESRHRHRDPLRAGAPGPRRGAGGRRHRGRFRSGA